jgi:hypothetical protein
MRFRALPNGKRSPAQQLAISYRYVVFNRALLFWCHLVLGAAAVLIYLSTMNIGVSDLNWRPGRGYNSALKFLLRCSPAFVPYLISVAFSRRRVTTARAGPWLFLLVLVAGTGAIGYFYLTRYEATAIGLVFAVLLQTAAYVLAAVVLLPRED